jgi:hypothetical protein
MTAPIRAPNANRRTSFDSLITRNADPDSFELHRHGQGPVFTGLWESRHERDNPNAARRTRSAAAPLPLFCGRSMLLTNIHLALASTGGRGFLRGQSVPKSRPPQVLLCTYRWKQEPTADPRETETCAFARASGCGIIRLFERTGLLPDRGQGNFRDSSPERRHPYPPTALRNRL